MGNADVKIGDEIVCFDAVTMISEIAKKYADKYEHDIIAVYRNGKVCELNKLIGYADSLEFITTDTVVGHTIYVRGAVRMMLKALYEIIGGDVLNKVRI